MRACRAAALLAVVTLAACRAPTEVTLAITTDAACSELHGVSITVSAPRAVDVDGFDVVTPRCLDGGQIGSMVLLPASEDDEPFGVRVVGGRGVDVASCRPPDYG